MNFYFVDNPKMPLVFIGNWVGGGHMEGRGGDLTSPAHGRNHIS